MIDILNLHFISFIHPVILTVGELCGDNRQFGITVNTCASKGYESSDSSDLDSSDEVGILHGKFFHIKILNVLRRRLKKAIERL